MPHPRLLSLAHALDRELHTNVLPYWFQTMDRTAGGFFGHVTHDNQVDPRAPKGVVMHSRHLWTSSAAWLVGRNPVDLAAADHAFAFLTGPLLDQAHGGFWWAVGPDGRPGFEQKVLYGQAFAVYGLSQYARATGNPQALDLALATFTLLEKTGRDRVHGGYYEAVDRTWSQSLIHPLSDHDIPCAKSMNTNLHVLEAYSALYLATGRPEVKEALGSLLGVFERHILVTPEHLGLYFDRDWKPLTDHVSYGHDVEASWLMTEAAQVLAGSAGAPGGPIPAAQAEVYARIARKSLALVQTHGGGLVNELHHGHLDTTRIWWVQAEALVGMVNGWELTGDEAFLDAAEAVWAWIETYQINRTHGEWHWAVDARGVPDLTQPKGGMWKTNYHNGRACLEVMHRAHRHQL